MPMTTWIRPERTSTQYVIKKAGSSVDGYELSLSNNGRVFVRFNQGSVGNDFKLLSLSPYPVDGQTWMHIAVTFDGHFG